MTQNGVPTPIFRCLRGYSFDPSLSVQLDTALVNEAVFKIRWEPHLQKGPVGEYLEVIDYDPASQCFYEPVDLNDPYILAQDGLLPSESDPQFHQQMVYAVAMTTIQNFEKALGRKALWSSFREGKEGNFLQQLRIYPHALRQANAYYSPARKALLFGYFPASSNAPSDHLPNGIVFTCLSHDIVAHETTHALLDGMHRRFIEASHQDTLAFHEAFADIVALFQHFSFPEVLRQQIAKTRGDLASQSLLGQLAQQFGRAIGQYGALRDAIGEFDEKENTWKPRQPDPNDYQTELEPHARGAILVAAVFEAFLSIYRRRVADLLRIASNGTGILTPGELHPDLVNRLASEAAKSAQQVLNMCLRALDYCPPVDINFGDYLRAIITADTDLVSDDDQGYRIAFIEAFRRRGIYPRDLRVLSEQSLCWKNYQEEEQQGIFRNITARLRFFVHQLGYLDEFPRLRNLEELPDSYKTYLETTLIAHKEQRWNELDGAKREKLWKELFLARPLPDKKWQSLSPAEKLDAQVVLWQTMSDREKIFSLTRIARAALHRWLADYKAGANSVDVKEFEELTGLYFLHTNVKNQLVRGLEHKGGKYTFEVHSFRVAQRVGPDGGTLNEVIISLTQQRIVSLDDELNSEHDPGDFDGLSLFRVEDLVDVAELVAKLKAKSDPVSARLRTRLTRATVKLLNEYLGPQRPGEELLNALVGEINKVLTGPSLYQAARFKDVQLSAVTVQLIGQRPKGAELLKLNRLLLQDAYPDEIVKNPFAFRGGCTLILDLQTLKLKYVVKKLIDNTDGRLARQRAYRTGAAGASLRATYFGKPAQSEAGEPFALLHSDL